MSKFGVLILIVGSLFCFSSECSGQKVKILLKDSTRITEEVNASSETQLFIKDRSITYSEIVSVTFKSNLPSDKTLHERLSMSGVQIIVDGKIKIIDTKFINDQPQKGDTKIILVCSDSLDSLYKRIGKHLAMKGYAIESSNRDFLTIKTVLRPTSRWNFSYFLSIVIENKSLIITSEWKLNNSILAGTRESGLIDWEFENDKRKGLSMTAQSVIYNDIMVALSDFDKEKVKYQ